MSASQRDWPDLDWRDDVIGIDGYRLILRCPFESGQVPLDKTDARSTDSLPTFRKLLHNLKDHE